MALTSIRLGEFASQNGTLKSSPKAGQLFRAEFRLAREGAVRQDVVMRLEHCALQVPDAPALADWYVKHLGCAVERAGGAPSWVRFLAAGPVLIEIYQGSSAPTPDYRSRHPAQFHLAFVSENLKADRERLLEAGATIAEDCFTNPVGDELLMLRDPWGIGLQLVKRARPMLP
jgi:catechol 2,3-dioxygenase-like lactoylglutathione lyase family enzyme